MGKHQIALVCNNPLTLYLGNYDACNNVVLPPDCNILHVWHRTQPGLCEKKDTGIWVEYKEHDLLSESQITLVVNMARAQCETKTPLFIHCAAGLGRSPTLAVLALVACGMKPWDAMAIIAEAMWKQYAIPHAPSFDCKVLNQIFDFYDKSNVACGTPSMMI